MRDRCCVQHRVGRAQVGQQVDHEVGHLGHLAARGENHRLGLAGGAAGEAQPQGRFIVAVDRAGAGRAGRDQLGERGTGNRHLARQVAAGLAGQQRPGAGVAELVFVFGAGFAQVERHPDKARFGQRVVDDQAFDAVAHHRGDPVAGHEAHGQQAVAQAVGGGVELRERDVHAFAAQGDVVLIPLRSGPDHVSDLHGAQLARSLVMSARLRPAPLPASRGDVACVR